MNTKYFFQTLIKNTGSVTIQNESVLHKDHGQYRLLPPIKEAAFNSSDMDLLRKVVHHHGNLQVLMLHKYSSAAVVNGEICGYLTSRQKSNPLILTW